MCVPHVLIPMIAPNPSPILLIFVDTMRSDSLLVLLQARRILGDRLRDPAALSIYLTE